MFAWNRLLTGYDLAFESWQMKRTTIASLDGPQKAAALLLAMGHKNALRITEFLSPEEMQVVVGAAQGLPGLSVEDVSGILSEFKENFEISGITAGAKDLASLLDTKAPVETKPSEDKGNKFVPDAASVTRFFETEPPMMCAVLLTEIDDQVTAAALKELGEERRCEIVNAFLSRKPLSPELDRELKQRIVEVLSGQKTDDKGNEQVTRMVSVITLLEEEESKKLLESIAKKQPALAAEIERSIFRFADIVNLEVEDIAKVVDLLETDVIVAALTGAEEGLQELVKGTLSQRSRKMVESEMARGGIAEEKVEIARRKVASAVISLANDGKLKLPEK